VTASEGITTSKLAGNPLAATIRTGQTNRSRPLDPPGHRPPPAADTLWRREASVAEEYRAKIEEAEMPQDVEEQALKELGRLERMGATRTGESRMIPLTSTGMSRGRGARAPRATSNRSRK